MLRSLLLMSAVILVFCSTGNAKVQSQSVDYASGKTSMEGFVAWDGAKTGARPGILIVHDWMGLSDFTKKKAEQLAQMGYVAFAADIYGKGIRPQNGEEAGKLAGKFKSDRSLLRAHVRAAFDKLAAMKEVDPKNIVVMGYCFGGTTALELARSGAPIAGTVSFHGGLSTPTPQDAKNIHGPVLVMHGADDPYVPADEVAAFKEEMKNGKVALEFIAYPGAVHAFAVPGAGNDKSKGAAYDAKADKESWKAFRKFLGKVFKNP